MSEKKEKEKKEAHIGIRLTRKLNNLLEQTSRKEKISKAHLIRKALNHYISFSQISKEEVLSIQSIKDLKTQIKAISFSIERELNPFIRSLESFYKFLNTYHIDRLIESLETDPSNVVYLKTLSNLFGDE